MSHVHTHRNVDKGECDWMSRQVVSERGRLTVRQELSKKKRKWGRRRPKSKVKPWKWWAASKALKTNIWHGGELSAPKDKVYLLRRRRKGRWHNEVAGIWSKPDTAAEAPSCMTTWHHDGCRQHSHSGPLNLMSLSCFFSPPFMGWRWPAQRCCWPRVREEREGRNTGGSDPNPV